MKLRPDEISDVIKKQIQEYQKNYEVSEFGTVIQVGDGIARIFGLENCMASELLEFSNGVFGMAMNLEEDNVGAVILSSDEGIKEGDIVKPTGSVVEVPVGEAMIGRVVNALGQPIDGKNPIKTSESRPIESPVPGVLENTRSCSSFSRPMRRPVVLAHRPSTRRFSTRSLPTRSTEVRLEKLRTRPSMRLRRGSR